MDTSDRILLAIGDLKGELGELRAEGRGRDASLEDIKKLIADHVASDNAVAGRVSDLEHARSRVKGMVIVISLAGGALTTIGVAVAKAIL